MSPALPHNLRKTLRLTSSLSELSRVAPWVSELAAEYAISPETRFAIELCLEEALSNIVRHGYRGEAGRAITVVFASTEDRFIFSVEDGAPAFEPLEPSEAPPQALETMTPGGQGIRLLYRFAGAVHYERLAQGNRLMIEFWRAEHRR